jgi:hypothetical protein
MYDLCNSALHPTMWWIRSTTLLIDLLLTKDLQSSRSAFQWQHLAELTPASLWGNLSPSWTSHGLKAWEVQGERQSTSRRWRKMIGSWLYGFKSVWIEPKRSIQSLVKYANRRWSASNGNASSWELTQSDFIADRPNLIELIDQI